MTKGPFDGRSQLDIDTHRQVGADLPPPVPPGTALHAWRRTGVEAKPTQAESQRGLTIKRACKNSARRRYLRLAVRLRRPADQALKRFEGLPGKFAVEFADFLRLGYRILIGPFDEFGLHLHRLIE